MNALALAAPASTAAPTAALVASADFQRAASVVLQPLKHPLALASVAHVALAGLLLWLLLQAAGARLGVHEALAFATPAVVVMLLAATLCPCRQPRAHALQLLGAAAVLPVMLMLWAATLPIPLAPVVVAIGLVFTLACHFAAFGLGTLAVRARLSHTAD